MGQKMKSVSLVTIMMLSVLSTLLMATVTVSANTVVITEAIQVVDGGTAADQQAAVSSDSEGNVHVVWTRNNLHLYYAMLSPRGDTLIDTTQITNPGLHKIWHPDMTVDEFDRIHVVWTDKSSQHKIVYSVLNPWATPMDGSASDDGTISSIDDHVVSMRSQNRDWPAIDLDSQGNAHIVWEDSYDELNRFFNQPQIYYSMLQPDPATGSVVTLFDDTLLTPIIGHKGHPDIVVDANDYVQIAWDDTRGGKVELAFIVDTSGSMYSEWADICTVVYGGNFASGGYFQGSSQCLKTRKHDCVSKPSMVLATPFLVLQVPVTALGRTRTPVLEPLRWAIPGDDSGGIRKLPGTVYNGNTYAGYSGEDWGPGTNWACLSWKDASGNVPGNPPTARRPQVEPERNKDGDPSFR